MNDIFDKLIIRLLFTLFLCIALFIYKFLHQIVNTKFRGTIEAYHPSQNYVETLYLFSRFIGIAIIFTTLEFNEYNGLLISTLHFFTWGTLSIIIYLFSLFVMESIIFYNFDYKTEILKKQNPAYGLISFTLGLCVAFTIKVILQEAETSLLTIVILLPFLLVLLGFAAKMYPWVSKLSFNGLMIQKNYTIGFSYSGYLVAATILITSTFTHEHYGILSYLIQVVLKILLGLLILPMFQYALLLLMKISPSSLKIMRNNLPQISYGIFEGSLFLISALLTASVIGHVHFGTIYPFF